MYYFGTNLDNRFAVPDFWPKPEQTNKIPYEREEIAAELDRLKAQRLERRARRLELERLQAGEEAKQSIETVAMPANEGKQSGGILSFLRRREN
jgi:protein PET100, fungi type